MGSQEDYVSANMTTSNTMASAPRAPGGLVLAGEYHRPPGRQQLSPASAVQSPTSYCFCCNYCHASASNQTAGTLPTTNTSQTSLGVEPLQLPPPVTHSSPHGADMLLVGVGALFDGEQGVAGSSYPSTLHGV